ncbi:MAG: BrnA antitoxin family protein [Desulfamplus sp.]|nr:BrnA antitoxin family protein [Desulfamplus sp.]
MPKLKHGTIIPTDEEDRLINEGIAADPDTFEMTDEQFAMMRPVSETHPEIVQWYNRTRGKQKSPVKTPVFIRLNPRVVDFFKSNGKGWQSEINDVLQKYVDSKCSQSY